MIDLENEYVKNYNRQFNYQLVVTGSDGTTYPISRKGKQGIRKNHRGQLFTTKGGILLNLKSDFNYRNLLMNNFGIL